MSINKKYELIVNTLYIITIISIICLIIHFILPGLTPFLIGGAIALILKKPIEGLNKRTGIKYSLCAIIITVLFYLVTFTLMAILSLKAWNVAIELVNLMPSIVNNYIIPILTDPLNIIEKCCGDIDPSLVNTVEELTNDIVKSLGSIVASLSVSFVEKASSLATLIPGLFVKLVLTTISTFFIATDYPNISDYCRSKVSAKSNRLIKDIKGYLIGTLWVCIKSYLIIMSLTFVEMSIGLTVLSIDKSILIAFIIAIFDILPVLGTGGILIPWTIICLIDGNIYLGLGLLVLYIIVTVIRNIVEPRIVGSQLGLHPIVTLASMFTGLHLFGGLGLFGLPIGLSLILYLNKQGTIKFIQLNREHCNDESESEAKEIIENAKNTEKS